MARRKVTEMAVLKRKGLRGYEAIWAHIRGFENNVFTIKDIEMKTNAPKRTVQDYIIRLVRAGYLKMVACNQDGAKLYKLQKRPMTAPRLKKNGDLVTQGTARDQMWRTMKMLGVFTAQDLSINATTAEVEVTERYAKDYITFMVKAEYIKVIRPHSHHPNGGQAQYRFLSHKNTGPKAPMIQRVKHVYDPNLEQVVWPKEDGES